MVLALTSAQRLRVVPVRVPHVDTLDDSRALLQGMPRVTRELHGGAQIVGGVGGGKVPILDVGFVAVAPLKGCRKNPISGVHMGAGEQQSPIPDASPASSFELCRRSPRAAPPPHLEPVPPSLPCPVPTTQTVFITGN